MYAEAPQSTSVKAHLEVVKKQKNKRENVDVEDAG